MSQITIIGSKVISVSRDGRRAQIRVNAGAYRGTYHCTREDGRWLTAPNFLGDQLVIVVEKQK